MSPSKLSSAGHGARQILDAARGQSSSSRQQWIMLRSNNVRERTASSSAWANADSAALTWALAAAALERAQQQGRIARDLPVQVLLRMVTGVLRGAVHGPPLGPRRRAADLSAAEIWAALEKLLTRTAIECSRPRSLT